ncbi:NIF3 like protein [Termitomyces sp. J132]|nr:NIF3 like protein [Termitomyces sp. J132]
MSNPFLKSVCRAMERIAPLRLAESWDNVRGTISIDLTTAVLNEAIAKDASVIVSYHPPIFRGLKALTLKTPLQSTLLQCAAHGISIYSPHSALDSVSGGLNDWLADGILQGRENGSISSLVGDKVSSDGVVEGGEGRLVTLHSAISMSVLESRIKEHLKLSQIQVGYATSSGAQSASIRTVAICAGSGGSMLTGKEADVYFTGEMSHHEVLSAVAAGTHVILCQSYCYLIFSLWSSFWPTLSKGGHDRTERGFLPDLASRLRHELECDADQDSGIAGVEVLVSQKDQHPLRIV